MPQDIAERLSMRELIKLSERKSKVEAARLLALGGIIYHSAISTESKKAQKLITETFTALKKAT